MASTVSFQVQPMPYSKARRRLEGPFVVRQGRQLPVLSHPHRATVPPGNLQEHQMPRHAAERLLPARSVLRLRPRTHRDQSAGRRRFKQPASRRAGHVTFEHEFQHQSSRYNRPAEDFIEKCAWYRQTVCAYWVTFRSRFKSRDGKNADLERQ